MGRMAVEAAVSLMPGEMTVGRQHLALDIRVTLEADGHGHLGFIWFMAGRATLRIGFVQDITHQGGPVTAVRIMAGQTVLERGGIVPVALPQVPRLVAGAAQCVGCGLQQQRIPGIMRTVTRQALSFGIRFMGIFEFPRQLFMALQAIPGQVLADQSLDAARMRVMTGRTVSPVDRLMDKSLLKRGGLLRMAGIAELPLGQAQQPFKPGHVRIMTGRAFTRGHGLMDHFALKESLLMALKADIGRRDSSRHKQPEQGRNVKQADRD